MKKLSFLMVALFTILISTGASAYSVKTTAEIQSFFNSTTGTTQEKLRDSINALNFHATKLQAELNGTPTSTKPGMLIPMLSPTPANGVISASSSPIFGINFYATGTQMVVDSVKLRITVKKAGVQENPASVISHIIVTGGTGSNGMSSQLIIPVNTSTFTKIASSTPEATIYYIDIKDLKIIVPSGSGTAKQMLVSAVFYPVDAAREISVSVFGSQGIKATSEQGISTYYGIQDGRSFTYSFNPNSRKGTPVMPPTNSTGGQAVPLPKTSLLDFFKNMTASVSNIFKR